MSDVHDASEDRAIAVLLDIAEDTETATIEERMQAASTVLDARNQKRMSSFNPFGQPVESEGLS